MLTKPDPPPRLRASTLSAIAVLGLACAAFVTGCDGALPTPDPGRFEAVVDGDLAASLTGRAVLAPARFSYSMTPPRRYAVHPIELDADADSLHGLIISLVYQFPGDGPAPDIPEGTFEIANGEGTTPLASAGVSTGRGSLLLDRGRVTIRRVPEGVVGTVEGYGTQLGFSGRRVSANVRATFFATPGPTQP